MVLGVLRVNAIKNRPEEGAWLFYNKPFEVKPVTIDPRAQGFVYYIDHIVNQSFWLQEFTEAHLLGNAKEQPHKLENPRINRITFHTFRHWKATMEYHKTKDILHVMRMLGHKNIKNTLIYTQLVTFQNDDYTCKVAVNIKEAEELIEAGYEYVCEMDSQKLFRKRK